MVSPEARYTVNGSLDSIENELDYYDDKELRVSPDRMDHSEGPNLAKQITSLSKYSHISEDERDHAVTS